MEFQFSSPQAQELLKTRNFSKISLHEPAISGDAESAVGLISAYVFEKRFEKLQKLESLFTKGSHELGLAILQAFRAIESLKGRRQAIAQLISQKNKIGNSPYILAEWNFLLGMLFGQIDDLELSKEFFQCSVEYYKRSHLPVHLWMAEFNIFLLCRRMGQPELALKFREKTIGSLDQLPPSACFKPYWFSSTVLYTELQFEKALSYLQQSLVIAQKLKSSVQIHESLSETLFLNYKAHQGPLQLKKPQTPFMNLAEKTYANLFQLISCPSHQVNLKHLENLQSEAQHPFLIHRIVDVFLDRSRQSLLPQQRLETIDFAEKSLIERKMYIPLYNFDLARLESYLDSKMISAALVFIQKLEDQKFSEESPLNFQNFQNCLNQLNRSDKKRKIKLFLNLNQNTLVVDGTFVNLAQLPLIEQALKVLIENPKGLSKENFFQKIYQQEYSTELSEPRLQSLFRRLRALLGAKNRLDTKRKRVRLNQIEVLSSLKKLHHKNSIIFEIIVLLENSPEGLSSLQISQKLGLSLRSVQMKLAQNELKNKIIRIKRGRTSKYYLT